MSPLSVFLIAIACAESDNQPYRINTDEQAYGLYQVREKALADFNRAFGKTYTLQQCLDPRICEEVFRGYTYMYGAKTFEEQARIWNGGPHGMLLRDTEKYWERVQRIMVRIERESHG